MRLGTTELILILIIAIALFGTSRIAGIGKAMGKSIREFIGKAMGKSIREFKEELNPDDSDEKKEEAGRTHEEL